MRDQFFINSDRRVTCRYDVADVSYDNMTQEMLCPQSDYDLTGHLYRCVGDVGSQARIYVSCIDGMVN